MSSDLIITRPEGESRTPGGLIVPTHLLPRETWVKDEVKKMDRAVLLANQKGLEVVLVCKTCKEPMSVKEDDLGRVTLECRDKVHVLRRDV